MKRSLAVAAGALALLGLALLARPRPESPGVRRASASAESPRPADGCGETAAPMPAAASPARASAFRPTDLVLDKLCRTFAAVRAKVRLHAGSGTPYAPGELEEVMALERGVEEFGAALARAVAESPDEGRRAIDRLLAMEDEEAALRIGRMIAGALDGTARERLAAALAGGGGPRERRVALGVLGGDDSRWSLLALLHAAQADADPSVRTAALLEARSRPSRHPEEGALVREVAATRAACEPDETARRAAASAALPPAGVEGRIQAALRRGR